MQSKYSVNYKGTTIIESDDDIIYRPIEGENTNLDFFISDERSLKESNNNKVTPVTSETVVESLNLDLNKKICLTITCLEVPELCVTIDDITLLLAESVISKTPFIKYHLKDKKLLAIPNIVLPYTAKEIDLVIQILKKVEDEIKDILASGTDINLVINKMESSNLNSRCVDVVHNDINNQHLTNAGKTDYSAVKDRTLLNNSSIATSSNSRNSTQLVRKDYSGKLLPSPCEQIDLTAKDVIFQYFRKDTPVQSTIFFN